MPTYHVVCRDCPYESTHDERYIAAAERDTHADKMDHFEDERHDVEYEEVADAK